MSHRMVITGRYPSDMTLVRRWLSLVNSLAAPTPLTRPWTGPPWIAPLHSEEDMARGRLTSGALYKITTGHQRTCCLPEGLGGYAFSQPRSLGWT